MQQVYWMKYGVRLGLLVLFAALLTIPHPPAEAGTDFFSPPAQSCETGELGPSQVIDDSVVPWAEDDPGISSVVYRECLEFSPSYCAERGAIYVHYIDGNFSYEDCVNANIDNPGLNNPDADPGTEATYSANGADCSGFAATEPSAVLTPSTEPVAFNWREANNTMPGFTYVIVLRDTSQSPPREFASETVPVGTSSTAFAPDVFDGITGFNWSVLLRDDSQPPQTLCRSDMDGGQSISIAQASVESGNGGGTTDVGDGFTAGATEPGGDVCAGFKGTQPTDGFAYGEQTFYWDTISEASGGYTVTVTGCGETFSSTVAGAGSNTTTLDLTPMGMCMAASWSVTALAADGSALCTDSYNLVRAAGPPAPNMDDDEGDDDDDDDGEEPDEEYTPPDDDYTPPDDGEPIFED